MAKITAIEFDDNAARVVVAKTSGSSFQLQSAFEVELESSIDTNDPDFGSDLAAALGNRVGRCDALVSLGRGSSELRVINVPVVPDSELPDIVRFQAMRQFSNSAEDAPIDFLPLTESGDDKKVLAATVPAEVIENLKKGCQAAGLNLKGVKLRATGSVALCHSISPERKNYIVLDPAAKSFNLEVVAYGKLCLTRTIRSMTGEPGRQIVREVRRTLAAANNQISDYETDQIVVLGDESEFAGLREAITNDLQFDVTFINPFDKAPGLSELPERVGTYASLIGLLVDHTSKMTETIDFLNPRRNLSAGEGSNVKMLAGIAIAVLFIGMIGLAYVTLSSTSNQIDKINQQISSMAKNDEYAKELIGNVAKVEAFENTQAVWLRELANLSEDFPEPDFSVVNSATLSLKPNNEESGTLISFSGYVDGLQTPAAIENGIRDDIYHVVIDDVFLLSEKEKTQDYYTHKLDGTVFRTPELMNPEVSDEQLQAFTKKHAVATVEVVAEGEPEEDDSGGGDSEKENEESTKKADDDDSEPSKKEEVSK